MKKSEAVKLIEETIYDSYDYDPDKGWTVDAEAVLDALLKEGMLPPEYSKRLTIEETEELGTNDPRYFTGYDIISQWEPEDD